MEEENEIDQFNVECECCGNILGIYDFRTMHGSSEFRMFCDAECASLYFGEIKKKQTIDEQRRLAGFDPKKLSDRVNEINNNGVKKLLE